MKSAFLFSALAAMLLSSLALAQVHPDIGHTSANNQGQATTEQKPASARPNVRLVEKIVFAADFRPAAQAQGRKQSEICAINPDGSGLVKLTNNGAWNSEPAVSPDGTMIAFISTVSTGKMELHLMRADGSDMRQLTSAGCPLYSPAFTFDSGFITFSMKTKERVGMYYISLDGKEMKPFGPMPRTGNDYNATMSADGSNVVFASQRADDNKNWEIFCFTRDMKTTQITNDGATCPAISPDGKSILFQTSYRGYPAISRTSINGGDFVYLTNDETGYYTPAYSPNGTAIVCTVSSGDMRTALMVMNADGSGQRRITDAATDCTEPTWARIALNR